MRIVRIVLSLLVCAISFALVGCAKNEQNDFSFLKKEGLFVLQIKGFEKNEIQSNKGRFVTEAIVRGARLVDRINIPPPEGRYFIVDEPMVQGLILSRYLELKNERRIEASSSIYFLTSQTATYASVGKDGAVLKKERVGFAKLSLSLDLKVLQSENQLP